MNSVIGAQRLKIDTNAGLSVNASRQLILSLASGGNLSVDGSGLAVSSSLVAQIDQNTTDLATLSTAHDTTYNTVVAVQDDFNAHIAASDPHTGYVLESTLGEPLGVAQLGADGLLVEAQRFPASLPTFVSSETTLADGAGLTITHDTATTQPILSGWTSQEAPTEWKLLIHGNTFPFTDTIGNTVTNSGCALSNTSTPVGTGAIEFEPAGDRLTVAPGSFNWQGQWCLEFWVKPSSIGAQSGGRWIVGRLSGSTIVLGLIMASDGSGNVGLYLSSNGSSWDLVGGTTVATMNTSTWYHVVIQRDTTHFSCYVNGSRAFHISSATQLYSSTIPLTFANHPDTGVGDGKFVGLLTEIAVRSTAPYSGTSFTAPTSRYDVSTSRRWLALGIDYSASTNQAGDATTVTNISGSSYTATFTVRL